MIYHQISGNHVNFKYITNNSSHEKRTFSFKKRTDDFLRFSLSVSLTVLVVFRHPCCQGTTVLQLRTVDVTEPNQNMINLHCRTCRLLW